MDWYIAKIQLLEYSGHDGHSALVPNYRHEKNTFQYSSVVWGMTINMP